jgi:hypothetical protein
MTRVLVHVFGALHMKFENVQEDLFRQQVHRTWTVASESVSLSRCHCETAYDEMMTLFEPF